MSYEEFIERAFGKGHASNRECKKCGELTGSRNYLCPTCDYNNLPTSKATEMLYSIELDEYGNLESMEELAYEEDLALEDLQLVNTELEEPDLMITVDNWVSDFMHQFDDPEDIDIPTSLLIELEKFCHTLPKLYTPSRTKPKWEDL